MRVMGIVTPASMAVSGIGVSEYGRQVFWAVCVDRPRGILGRRDAGFVLEQLGYYDGRPRVPVASLRSMASVLLSCS